MLMRFFFVTLLVFYWSALEEYWLLGQIILWALFCGKSNLRFLCEESILFSYVSLLENVTTQSFWLQKSRYWLSFAFFILFRVLGKVLSVRCYAYRVQLIVEQCFRWSKPTISTINVYFEYCVHATFAIFWTLWP